MNFDSINNLDLLSVGVAIAAIGILGFMVLFSNRKSVTNRTFFAFAVAGILWAVFNYSYQQPHLAAALWLLRLHTFFAVWYVFAIFQVFYVFPKDHVAFPRWYKFILLPYVSLVSVLTLTPLVFSRISAFSSDGRIMEVVNGPGIFLFGITVMALIFVGPFILVRRSREATPVEKRQFAFVLIGTIITFSLHFVFNMILPAFFNDPRFISLGGTFIFPFVAFTSYAIFKHHLLNIKVIATEVVSFVLAISMLFEVIIAREPAELMLRFGVFCLTLAFGILLIRSVLKEVEQREQLEKLTKELEKKNVELDSLSRFKTQLLSLASHQIKAPLAVIKGFVSILHDGLYGPVTDKIKETLDKVKFSADDLIDLINTLLDMRKVEEGKMDYVFVKTDLKELGKEVVEGLRPLADNKHLELSYACAAEHAYANADAQKLKQVMQNLIDNAIKYTPSGSVRAELHDERDFWLFSVVDTGLGLPADLLPHLFEEFIRDERVKGKIRGTGLGLYIARRIVEAHGGVLWAESEGEGKGSAFRVRLPKLKE